MVQDARYSARPDGLISQWVDGLVECSSSFYTVDVHPIFRVFKYSENRVDVDNGRSTGNLPVTGTGIYRLPVEIFTRYR